MGGVRNCLTYLLTVLVLGTTSACTSMQTRSSASANLEGVGYDQAFQVATQAAMDAGFTIGTANKDAGLITATRGANFLLAHSNPSINIIVLEYGTETMITIASTVAGQVVDYGTTAATVQDFCAALRIRQPNAECLFQ